MVRDVVLRSVRSSTWVSRQLSVRGQDVGDGQTSVIDEVAAVIVLCRAVLGDCQLVAIRIVDVGYGTRRAFLDGPWQLQVVVCQGQGAQAVGLHRAVGVVLEGLAAPVALERPQPVRAAGVGVGQRLGTGSRPRQGGDVAATVVLDRLAVARCVPQAVLRASRCRVGLGHGCCDDIVAILLQDASSRITIVKNYGHLHALESTSCNPNNKHTYHQIPNCNIQ